MATERWSRADTLAGVGVVATLLAIAIGVLVPEVRRLIGLQSNPVAASQPFVSSATMASLATSEHGRPEPPTPGGRETANTSANVPPPTFTIAESLDHHLAGLWTGDVAQRGFLNTYPIIVRLKVSSDGILAGEASYPTLNCEADWLFLEKTANEFRLIERVRPGRHTCIDSGTAIIRVSGPDMLNWAWIHPNGRREAAALLERK